MIRIGMIGGQFDRRDPAIAGSAQGRRRRLVLARPAIFRRDGQDGKLGQPSRVRGQIPVPSARENLIGNGFGSGAVERIAEVVEAGDELRPVRPRLAGDIPCVEYDQAVEPLRSRKPS